MMAKGVFYFAVFLFARIRPAHTALEKVWLKDVTIRYQTEKRTLSELVLSNELTFHLTREAEILILNLKRNYAINPNADIYFVQKLKNGQSALVKTRNLGKEDVAYYQDWANGAFMTVRCVKKSHDQCERVINGHIRIEDSSYDLSPSDNDFGSASLLENSSFFGKPYILQDTQRKYSLEQKDAEHDYDKKIEQELKTLLQRSQGQHKQNHFHPSYATLLSRNVTVLHNRVATDISRRQKKKVYYVKVAVLIDSGLWDLYLSMVPILNPTRKRRTAMKMIRQAFSHIMNGVNLLYQGIEDRSISINVILTDIIVFKFKVFPQMVTMVSKAVIVNGTKYINAETYLEDIKVWDAKEGVKNIRVYDHGMLFTKYTLYVNSTDNVIGGLTYRGRVCDAGKRTSVVWARDFVRSVGTAAHELGHSLGAHHDGEMGARTCKADDFFIMSYLEAKLNPTRYSRNPWLFSNCSVDAFKETLRHKKCTTKPGSFYDDDEYKQYVMNEPGEDYLPDDQCHFIIGRKSACCETALVDVCTAMRCTDPLTGNCNPRYYGAARGTKCGENRWCIEGRCVSKVKNIPNRTELRHATLSHV